MIAFRFVLRWMAVVEIVGFPILGVWLLVMASRLRRQQEEMHILLKTWGTRMVAISEHLLLK